jgi:hypothetical protein
VLDVVDTSEAVEGDAEKTEDASSVDNQNNDKA